MNNSGEDKFIKLEKESINSLITFVKSNDLKSIFYYCTYYDAEDYMIKDDNIEEEIGERLNYFDQGLINSFMVEVEDYNKKSADMDISKPFELCFFTIYHGYFIGGCYYDDYLDSDYSEDYYDKLLELVEKYWKNTSVRKNILKSENKKYKRANKNELRYLIESKNIY